MAIHFRGASISLLVSLLAAACGPGAVNVSLNPLHQSVNSNIRNTNPRTESFLVESSIGSNDEPIFRAPISGENGAAASGARGPAVEDADGYFVGVAISGGGSRSANFAAGCMFELQRLGMLQKADCISAVSGGSLTAALYCSCPDEQWNPRTVQQRLTHPFASDLIAQVLLPWNLAGLGFGTLTVSDLLADNFNLVLFNRDGHKLTFADLRPDRPRLLINSTDLESGHRFTFCNRDFDRINSNLDQFPLGNAVCASSAIPIVMHPVTLRDYSTTLPHFYHLIDGCIYDNLGVRVLVESYEAQIQKKVNPYPHGAIIIVIDANTPFGGHLSSQASIGWLASMEEGVGLSSTVLLNRVSSSTMSELIAMHSDGQYTVEQIRQKIDQLWRDHYVELLDSKQNPVRIIHLTLGQVSELSDESFVTGLNSIPTSFDIDSGDAYALYKSTQILFSRRFDGRIKPLLAEMNRAAAPGTRPGK